MSALSCPVCQGSFREVLREGILIDVCTQCRGVWLDRGELEKLLSLSRGADEDLPPRTAEPPRQQAAYEQPRQPYAQPQPSYRRDDRDDDDDDRRKYGQGEYDQYGRKRKKKGFDFADIFDFGD